MFEAANTKSLKPVDPTRSYMGRKPTSVSYSRGIQGKKYSR